MNWAKSLLAMAVAGVSATAFAQAPAKPATPGRPNVLFIAIDDLKPLLGCYGSDVKTPNIDRLAQRSTVFLNNHCQQAVCGPTRASLMTGLRPDTTRVYDLKTRMRDINPDIVTIPQYFGANGYATTWMGKIHDGRCSDGWGNDDIKSWTLGRAPVQDPLAGQRAQNYADPELVKKIRQHAQEAQAAGEKVDAEVLRQRHGLNAPFESADVPDNAYADGALANSAVTSLRALSEKPEPFFLAVGFAKPHLPFNAPKKYWDLYQPGDIQIPANQNRPAGAPFYAWQDSWELRAQYSGVPKEGPIPEDLQRQLIHGYYACVSYVDANVGVVLDELDRLGIANNTIVVLWGDHGFHLGDHGMFCKHTNYEQATRSPLIISAPGLKPTPGKTNTPTEFVDIFPTLCHLAGLEIPKNLEGTSLVPLFRQPDKPVKALAISQYNRQIEGKPAMGYAYRGQRYRYVEWIQKDYMAGQATGPVVGTELYDYETDPHETRNLANDPAHAQTIAKFKALIANGPQGLQGRDSEGL